MTGGGSRPVDDDVVANVFARAYADTGNLADAFWVTAEVVKRQSTIDVGAVRLNEIVESVARLHELTPQAILGASRVHRVSVTRYEVWWLLRQRKLSFPAIAAAFERHHTTVIEGVRCFEALMAASAELTARVTWEAARWRRAA